MTLFLKKLKNRSTTMGWMDGILNIPEDPSDPQSKKKNLIENYGEIDIETIRKFETTYIDQQVRDAQDCAQLYQCLYNSLSEIGHNMVQLNEKEYTINGLPSGNLYLKIILRKSHVDTTATVANIRTKLTKLDEYITTSEYNITDLNAYVKEQTEQLEARGEESNDLLIHLYKAYREVKDPEFAAYMARIKDEQHKTYGGSSKNPNQKR